MRRLPKTLFAAAALFSLTAASRAQTDVVIYGGSVAGVMAAVQAARMGRTVALVAPEKHLGGITVNGLGGSDIDNHWFRNSDAVGGIAREFYLRVGKKYDKPGPVWRFESKVAEAVLEEMLGAEGPRLSIYREQQLTSVVKERGRALQAIRAASGREFSGRVFIDASIEGDLIAAAGVETIIGRESNSKYGETKNGIRAENTYRQFAVRVDPYKIPGNPKSGLIPTIQDEPYGTPGEGDHRLQGFCFRLCLTKNPDNRLPVAKPANFDRGQYEIYLRYTRAGGDLFFPVANLPNGKTDLGSWHDLSANLYGMNYAYPGGSAEVRRQVYQQHRDFTQGLLWFLANDPELPAKVREHWAGWGLCRDEFTDNGGWPRELYIRDARRMVSDYVITEQHNRRINPEPVSDPVAVAFWPSDTHHVRRIVKDGAAYNEGFVFGGDDWGPFGISMRALLPRRAEATNLIAAAALSSSHVAYGAVRLEWTFMALGQASAVMASEFLGAKQPITAVQDVDYRKVRESLIAAKQVLALNSVPAKSDATK